MFSGTSELMSLKVEICFGQNATVGVLEMLTRKIVQKVSVWKQICNTIQAVKTEKQNLIWHSENKLSIQTLLSSKVSYS